MEYEYEHGVIDRWYLEGMMTPEAVLKTISEDIVTGGIFSEKELAFLEKTFKSVSTARSGRRVISENDFSKLFEEADETTTTSIANFSKIIYRSISYLSAFPFAKNEQTEPITFEAFVRGVAFLYPERAEKLIIYSNFTRPRTVADHRRLIFQSFATNRGEGDTTFDEKKGREDARRQAFDFPDEDSPMSFAEYASTNFDDDGDQLFHDVLDFLSFTHPMRDRPPWAPYHREAFRPLAKRLHNFGLKLHHLSIARSDMDCLVSFLLRYRWKCPLDHIASQDWDTSAACITQSFLAGKDGGITWFQFDRTKQSLCVSLPPTFKP